MFVAADAPQRLRAKRRAALARGRVRDLVREAKRLNLTREELLQLVAGEADKEELL